MSQSQSTLKQQHPKYMFLLDVVERAGNKLPHPVLIFLYLTVFVMAASWIFNLLGTSVMVPGKKEELLVKSLLSAEGLQYMLSSTISNFVEFKPLGIVVVLSLGVGLAEKVGLFEAAIKKTLIKAPKGLITYAVFFIGIMSNIAADSAYIIVPPMAAMIFHLFGRNPIAGLAAGIAGTGIGFSANLVVSSFDAALSGLSTQAAHTIDPKVVVHTVDNWYFMGISVFILTIVGAFVNDKFVEPRLGNYKGDVKIELDVETTKDPLVGKALRNTFISAILFWGLIILTLAVPHSPLRGENGSIATSPFMDGINSVILLFFIIIGLTYGITVKKIKGIHDIVQMMGESIKDLSGFIVLAFFIAQFIAYLSWSNLTVFTAVNGAELLESMHLTGLPAIILLVLVTVLSSLFVTSGVGLWSLLAPIIVPMFMVLDFTPAFTQVAYRIADSVTNMITPLNPFVAVMLGFLIKYDKKAGLGTHIALVLPYTIAFLLVWIIMLVVFALLEIPIGPGVEMYLK